MISFSRRSMLEAIQYKFSRRYRERKDAELREAIKWLIEHPEAPCMIEGEIVPDGYGLERIWLP